MNTGHIMDDETFITHLLNSLPQTMYEGAILVIKDKLRKGTVDIPEIEEVLEDKYLAMKHAKGWEEEEDDYALFASLQNSDIWHTSGCLMADVPSLDHLWDGQKDCLDVGQVRCFHEETSRKTTFLEGRYKGE